MSFVEWLGRKVLCKIQGAALEAASNGLDLIAKWRETQEVGGDDLSLALMNEDDEGVYAYAESQPTAEANTAIEVVGGVISYAAWRVYKFSNKRMPQEYERASDEFVNWILEQVEGTAALSAAQIAGAFDYLCSRYKTTADVLGNLVEIQKIDEVVNQVP